MFDFWASLFADHDCGLLFNTRSDMIIAADYLYQHLRRFGLLMHIGREATPSKTEAVLFPGPGEIQESGDTSNFDCADGFISFTDEVRYLGSVIHNYLTSDAEVNK